jgi:hypothetical protein
LLRIVRRAAALMRTSPFSDWFPASHVAWWERASLDNLFRARVLANWPRLRRWSEPASWGSRIAQRCLRALAALNRWRYS